LFLPLNKNLSFITPSRLFLIPEFALSTSLITTISEVAIGAFNIYLLSTNNVSKSGIPLTSDGLVPSSVSRIYNLLLKSFVLNVPFFVKNAFQTTPNLIA
jgi:hypothetical protein